MFARILLQSPDLDFYGNFKSSIFTKLSLVRLRAEHEHFIHGFL